MEKWGQSHLFRDPCPELSSGGAGEGVLSYQDLTRQDVEEEPTGMYLWRVLVRQYPLPSAPSRYWNHLAKIP
jgi:hypothetical protein